MYVVADLRIGNWCYGGNVSPIRLGADCMLMLIEKERPPSRNRGVIKLYENLNHEQIAKIRGLLWNAYSRVGKLTSSFRG